MSTITITGSKYAVTAPSIVVNVPKQAAATVTVSPTPVTIQNHVEVPSRTIIAKPGRNGEVIMTPQGV